MVANTAEAAESMRLAGLPAPLVRPARSGDRWVDRFDGVWRMSLWVAGRITAERGPAVSAEAGRVLGLFHRALADRPPRLRPLPAADHNRDAPSEPEDWDRLIERVRSDPKYPTAASALDRGRELARTAGSIRAVTRAALHGDPKMDNILFDAQYRARTLIDLDTVRQGTLIWELGDGLRSWAGNRRPDDAMVLDPEALEAGIEAYLKWGLALTDDEASKLPRATAIKTLDLARRYLADHFDEAYFLWDQTRYRSPADQNLSRGRGLSDFVETLLIRYD